MENVNTVLFLGAGASQFAGYQTFQRFGELITDPLVRHKEGLPGQSDETPRLIESLNQALRDMGRPTTHDNYLWLLTDYRTFCGKFDTHSGLQDRFPRIRDEIHAFESTTVTVINDLTQTTYCHYSRRRDLGSTGQEVRSLYEELARLNSETEPILPVFTTNYDLLLEDLFNDSHSSIPFVNGIPGRTRKESKWKSVLYQNGGIQLYRLHGCVGWFRDSDRDDLPAGGGEGHGRDTDDKAAGAVIFARPATLDGDMLRRLCVMFPGRELSIGSDPHGFAFRKLYYCLTRCKRVVFIGFSFRDDDVMRVLLAANAARAEPVQLRIVDPTIGPDAIRLKLRGASLRSPFMATVPPVGFIKCLKMAFGSPGFKSAVLDFVRET